MIDHVSIAVRDLEKAKRFYGEVLAPIGLSMLVERETTAGFGKAYPEFWLNERLDIRPISKETGSHICLRVKGAVNVEEFHEIAIAQGGESAGLPGIRQAAQSEYFGAFIFDLDGNKIEAVSF